MPLHTRRTTCRLCCSAEVTCVLSLEPSALAEAYLPPERAHEGAATYPLDLFLCRACGGVQLLDVIDAGHLFADYWYESATSPGLSEHFRQYAKGVVARFNPRPRDLVVDIGSNDGTLLKHFQSWGLRGVGVEPSRRLADAARRAGVETRVGFMDARTGAALCCEFGPAKIVTANNVLAHAEEPGVILDGIRELLTDDGVFVFEVSYLPELLRNRVFDYLYLEHGVFYTVGAMSHLLRLHRLELFDVQFVPTKGGSLRGFAQHEGATRPVAAALAGGEYRYQERDDGVRDPITYRRFLSDINAERDKLLLRLDGIRASGGTVAGYGASATVTTLLHHFKLGDRLTCLADDNPQRHGLVSPGHRLPVVAPAELYARKPDAVVILAWRFADQIMQAHPDAPWEWLVPLPEFRALAPHGDG